MRRQASGRSMRVSAPDGPRLDVSLIACWVFVVVGAFFRLYQYVWNQSLFIDEAALALNLRNHDFIELLGRLDHAQYAPMGFLFFQKILRELFGEREFVLRAPALAAGLASLPLFLVLARRVLPHGVSWIAVGVLALTRAPIFWSVDAKSYAFDMLATIGLTLLALDWLETPGRRAASRLGITGALAPYFSAASFIVLGGLGLVVLLKGWRERGDDVVLIFGSWLLAIPALIHSQLSLSPGDRAYYTADWWEGFLPLPWERGAAAAYGQQVARMLQDPLGFSAGWPSYIGMATLSVGTILLIRIFQPFTALAASVLLTLVCASIAGLYPVGQLWNHSGRVLLFAAPLLVICLAAGVALPRQATLRTGAGLLLLVLLATPALAGVPYSRGELRSVLHYVEAHALQGDIIYLYYATALPVAYYQPQFAGRVVTGSCAQHDRSAYLRELERLRGERRLWVITAFNTLNENFLIQDYMKRNAATIDSVGDPLGEARLYDFTGVAKHAPADVLLNPPYAPYAGTSCRGVFADAWLPYTNRTLRRAES